MAVRTWAPRGKTPVLRVKLTRDHLSAISGITAEGRLFMQVRLASYDSAAVVSFLRVLMRKMRGQDRGDLGWRAHPSRTRDQRLSQTRSRQTFASGTTSRLRS